MKYQVTFFDKENRYKPVATIIEAPHRVAIYQGEYKKAIVNICQKRGWTVKEFKNYGYVNWKCRKAE